MMKIYAFSILSLFFLFAGNSAQCEENVTEDLHTAKALYEKRWFSEEGIANALQAAKIYKQLGSASGLSLLQAGDYLTHAAQAYYYAGYTEKKAELKKTYFQEVITLMKPLGEQLEIRRGEPAKSEYAELLAKVYYWSASSGARKAELEGILSSISKWGELQEYMGYVRSLHQRGLVNHKNIEGFGANRVLGRAYFKIPRLFGGDLALSESLLEEAFNKTLDENAEVSVIGLNNVYYAETLVKNGKSALAKKILTLFVKYETHPEDLNPDRIPETTLDIQEAKEILRTL